MLPAVGILGHLRSLTASDISFNTEASRNMV